MEKKNEYISKLLRNLQNLEAKVSAIQKEEAVSFSFFRDAFEKGQEVMSLLHELEMLQIEDMKQQMEKLVSFLSETESRKSVSADIQSVEFEEPDLDEPVSLTEKEEHTVDPVFAEETQKIVQEEEVVRRNIHAEGITLPAYVNPRNAEPKTQEIAAPTPVEHPHAEKPTIRSVNDIIQAPASKLDIKRGLSLNDRFYYQRALFNNNREAMNSMMLRLNAFDDYESTERYLRENTSWNFDDENVASFLELLKKGFE